MALREWRLKRGWTLEELSDLTGRSVSVLSRYETGHRMPRPATRVRISRLLNAPIRELFPLNEKCVLESSTR